MSESVCSGGDSLEGDIIISGIASDVNIVSIGAMNKSWEEDSVIVGADSISIVSSVVAPILVDSFSVDSTSSAVSVVAILGNKNLICIVVLVLSVGLMMS